MTGRRAAGAGLGAAALALASLLVPAAAAATRATPGPEAFRSEAGRFAVVFPGLPHRSTRSQSTFAGPVHSAEYLFEAPPLELRVEVHDVPALASFFLSDEALLERAQHDLLSDDDAQEPRDAASTLSGYPSREVAYRLGDGDGRAARALLVLVGRRLYILVALHPQDASQDPDLERFFGSFRVWEP